MDFVTGLPESQGFDAIWVVVDRLTKMRHLVPCNTTIDSEGLAELFIKEIFRLHGLPDTIISDRGPQFASRFWRYICDRLKMERRLSTAYHPPTDGQTEIVNAAMEQYLRAFVSYQQDDWVKYLPLAEFAANNHASETTAMSPFFANYGFDPRMSLEAPRAPTNVPEIRARSITDAFAEIIPHLRSEMTHAQARHQEGANRRRVPAPNFKIGDRVWLNAKHLATERPARKLDWKRLGPFPVKRIVSAYAYELDLPSTIKVHPVFHVSLLSPAPSDPLPGQHNPPPPPVVVDGEEEYEIESVLDSKLFRDRLKYLVKWVGYKDPTCEPAEFLDSAAAVDAFHTRYPDKPGPLS